MSLIPYQPHEGREIVLRHNNAIVVRDSTSHRLEIRGLSECPTCHQPLTRPSSSEQQYDRSFGARHESYVDPDYFRMLRAVDPNTSPDRGPPSPIRRPALASSTPRRQSAPPVEIQDEAEFVSSTPGVAYSEGSRIRRDAFSPNYFKTFFVEEAVLGKGGKGVVLLVRHEIDGCHLGQFACKRVPVGDDHAWLEKVLIEVELLAKLSHPNLVSYRHVWLEDMRLNRFAPEVACAFILQQYCNAGDLHHYVIGGPPREATKEELKAQMRRRSKGQLEPPVDLLAGGRRPLSFDEIYSLFKDITSGVAYLHAANYIHRDLKPSNCLLHREGGKLTCLISDFGEVQPENVVRKSSGTTGTISYCAPEVLTSDSTGFYGNFTTKSDIFALGMILYFMCFGRLPYRSANSIQEELEDVDELRDEITHWQGFQDERRERPDLHPTLYQLLKKLLALDPAERPSANEVLKVMRGELNFDGLTREDHSAVPSIGLNGSRVQNLDSPAVPGSPVPVSRKHHPHSSPEKFQELGQWSGPSQRDSSPLASGRDDPQNQAQPPVARHRHAQSMVISRSQDGSRRSAVFQDDLGRRQSTERRPFSPPLLMAPPNSTNTLHQRLKVMLSDTLDVSGPYLIVLGYLVRLSLFAVKITYLARPCWPYMINLQVGIPLLAVAALDLGLPRLTSSSLTLRSARTSSALSSPLAWGMGTSTVLLALHFFILWIALGRNTLCATPPQESWHEWSQPEVREKSTYP
ncbi:Fc.00g054010.m01.CDS01 [Cosmosporella sp. VM-42]